MTRRWDRLRGEGSGNEIIEGKVTESTLATSVNLYVLMFNDLQKNLMYVSSLCTHEI